mgnify:CR=1 FL=1
MSNAIGVPDILALTRLGRAQADTQRRLDVAQQEVATGEAVDRMAAAKGDPLRLLALDNDIARIESRLPLMSLAKGRADLAQTSLQTVLDAVGDLPERLLAVATAGDVPQIRRHADEAKAALSQAVSALNASAGGRFVFGGGATGAAPIASAEEIVSMAVDYADGQVEDVNGVDINFATRDEALAFAFNRRFAEADPPAAPADPARTRFALFGADPGAGVTTMYLGGAEDAPPVELGDGDSLAYAPRGDHAAIRRVLMGLAGVVALSTTVTPPEEVGDAVAKAALETLGGRDEIIALKAEIGLSEKRIETAETRAQAEKTSLERARETLVGVDPYEAATRISALETQLQSIYAMTARTSRLSLLEFLR